MKKIKKAQNGKRVSYTNKAIDDSTLNSLINLGIKVQHSDEPINYTTSTTGGKSAGFDYFDIDRNIPITKYPKNFRNIASTDTGIADFPDRVILKEYVTDDYKVSPKTTVPLTDKPYYASYKNQPKYNLSTENGIAKNKKGGIIEDNRGQWAHPGKVTKINSNKITMKGVSYPVLGISDKGHKQLMQPEGEYTFNGNNVTEYPMMQQGGNMTFGQYKKKYNLQETPDYNLKRAYELGYTPDKDGHLPSVDEETLQFLKTKTHPSVKEELKWYNSEEAKDFKSKYDIDSTDNSYYKYVPKPTILKNGKKIKKAQLGIKQLPVGFGQQQLDYTGMPFGNSATPGFGETASNFLNFQGNKIAGGIGKADSALSPIGGIGGALSLGTDVFKGISMLKEEKNQKKTAEQSALLSDLTLQAASLRPDKPKRKYVRPEDQIIDPNTVANSYGVGSNFLKKGGKVNKKAQFGAQAGTFGSMIGSKIFGGTGEQSGAGQIGSTIGNVAGKLIPIPGASALLGFAGGVIGGAIGSGNQKDIQGYEDRTNSNLQNAAFVQGTKGIQDQYTGFMQHGGDTNMNGDLQPLWGGNAEHVSTNPYLPDGGESVLFRGQSHDDGGIGVKFGGNKVEVEGGEPAQKLNSGGNTSSLTVFGDMKIPAYGASEIGDDKAKGRKFKSYINDLNKVENKQNKVIDGAMTLIDKANPNDVYDKLKISSGEAMLIGGDMKLKDVAKKKQMASIVQNAILETAEEHGLKSDALADGKIRKAKKGTIIPYAQGGAELAPIDPNAKYVTEDQIADLEKQNYYKNLKKDPSGKTWTLDPIAGKTIPGKQALENNNLYLGSPEFQKAFGNARRKGLPDFTWVDGKKYTTQLAQNKNDYKKSPDEVIAGKPGDEVYLRDYKPSPSEVAEITPIDNPSPNVQGVGLGNFLGAYMPFLRPTNKLKLDPGQLAGEMYSLATNQLDPVQAQLYNPLLENVSDISYQDQLNANQADFNAISRQVQNNPSAQASLAAQKYAANSSVLGEEFRQNQNQRMGTYNRNRATLNDATLKNLQILDQQYVRQSTAKSNTKAIGQAALSSIADKIGQNKLENRLLAIDQQRYNYRFGPNGMAWNWNGPAQFNTQGLNLPTLDSNGREITSETVTKTDGRGNPTGTQHKERVKIFKKDNPKSKNGSLVKAYHS